MDGPLRVLHVEDDPDFAALTADALEQRDGEFVVDTAPDAEAGLERLATAEFDCIVSDYQIPGRNGIEFLETVREDHPELPFVLFTGKGGEEVASEAISAGVTDYLQKGFGSDRYALLANRVQNAVEQYRARAELERRERRMEALLEHSTDRISIVDDEGRYTFVSPATERLFGYDPENLEGDVGLEYVHPDDRDRVDAAFQRTVENPGEVSTIEYRYRHRDGSWRWVEARTIYRGDDPVIDGIIINSRDITERKEREEELLEAKERLELALEGGNFGVYDWNVLTNEIHFDERARAVLGLSSDEPTRDLGDLLERTHESDREGAQTSFQDLLADESEFAEVEYRMRTDDGEWRWIRSVGKVAERCEDGDPLRVVGVHHDVTERRQREQEIERQNERLERFASIVSHDLRNPMNVAAARVSGLGNEIDDYRLDQASNALDRMADIIDDVLNLARSGREVVDPEPIELGAAALRAWEIADLSDAVLEIEGTPGRVLADEGKLRQLLENLFRNAHEHAGPDVTIRLGRFEHGIFVEDDGLGIPADERDAVFESGYSTSESGTGFGLPIVREVANSHGWDVRLTESRDGGARFEFTSVGFAE